MLKRMALTGAVTMLLAVPVCAQTSGTMTPPRTTANPTGSAPITASPSQIDAQKLIGKSVQNAADDKTVGSIDSVMLNSSGKVQKVVMGVGGFLGVGKKDVAVDWNQLRVADNGRKITMNADKDQLKAMPEFTWPKDHPRGSVWTFAGSDNSATISSGSSGAMAPTTGTSPTR